MTNDLLSEITIQELIPEHPHILVVDDTQSILDLISKIFEKSPYILDTCISSGEAIEKLIDSHYELMLLDGNLPGISGFELLKYCKKKHPLMEIIMITGDTELERAVSTMKDGAFDYITKPFNIPYLKQRVKDAIEHQAKEVKKTLLSSGNESPFTNDIDQNILPGYTVKKTIGAGAMAIVLLVEKNATFYALKVLRRESQDEQYKSRLERFFREAQILTQINHENIIKVLEFGIQKKTKTPYILMEYIEGKTLSEFIHTHPLTIEEKLYIIAQIASALSAIHEENILHRDLKPSNILVEEGLHIKLSDFGVASILDSSLTLPHEVLGSPAYMPPEAFSNKLQSDHRADIFSLGVLCYELFTNTKPFHGQTIGEMMAAIQNVAPIAPRKIDKSIPVAIQNMLEKMLDKNPNNRFSSAQEIIEFIDIFSRDPKAKTINSTSFSKAFFNRVWR